VKDKARSLQDLGVLRDAMRRRERERAEQAARERAEARRIERMRDEFARAVGPVTPLRDRGLAQLNKPLPLPLPRQRERDEKAALASSLSDEFDVDSLLETDEALSFRRPDIGPDVLNKLRRGRWAVQAQLDLHGLRREEAREQLTVFLRESHAHGLRCVRVVHGKGHGSPGKTPVLKAHVRRWLVQSISVIAFVQARAAEGGAGALLVLLRPKQG
jgi:DNA-nicking Smr family endonuclease